MAGIRCNTPQGADWRYSLDTETWQADPVFTALPNGAAFVRGTVYTVYCKNEKAALVAFQSIPFGQATSDPTLNDLAKRTDLSVPQYDSPGPMVAADQLNSDRTINFMAWARAAGYIAVEMQPEYVSILVGKIIAVLATNPVQAAQLCALLPCVGSGGGSTGGGDTSAADLELFFAGCYQAPITAPTDPSPIFVSNKVDGDHLDHDLDTLTPLATFYRLIPGDNTFQLDPTITYKTGVSASYIILNIPGGDAWTGYATLKKPAAL